MSDIFKEVAAHVPAFEELREFSENKLFHPLIEGSFAVVQEAAISPDLAVRYFNEIVKPIGEKLNPVRFTELAGLVLRKGLGKKSLQERLTFLDDNFKGFDATGYLEKVAKKAADKKTSESSDKDGKLLGDKDKKKGGMSHYSKAAYADFLDAKALFLSFKCQQLCESGDVENAKDVMDDLTAELFDSKRPLVQIGAKVR